MRRRRGLLCGLLLLTASACCPLPSDGSMVAKFALRRPAMERAIALLDAHPWIMGCRPGIIHQSGTAEEIARGRELLPRFQEAMREAGLEGGIKRFGGPARPQDSGILPDAYLFTVSNCTPDLNCCEKGYLFTRHPDNAMLGVVVGSIEKASAGASDRGDGLRMELSPGWYVYQWRM